MAQASGDDPGGLHDLIDYLLRKQFQVEQLTKSALALDERAYAERLSELGYFLRLAAQHALDIVQKSPKPTQRPI